ARGSRNAIPRGGAEPDVNAFRLNVPAVRRRKRIMASDYRPVVLGCFAPNWTDLNEEDRLRDVDAERQSLGGLFQQYPAFLDYRECLIADYRPLQIALDEHRSRIVAFHFAGHADAHSLTLNAATNAQLSEAGFAPLLASLPSLKLVFLNGCGTSPWMDQ
ncbi:MAG: hypothetical protein ACKOU6_15010, partial [Planctomycetota bacterium]